MTAGRKKAGLEEASPSTCLMPLPWCYVNSFTILPQLPDPFLCSLSCPDQLLRTGVTAITRRACFERAVLFRGSFSSGIAQGPLLKNRTRLHEVPSTCHGERSKKKKKQVVLCFLFFLQSIGGPVQCSQLHTVQELTSLAAFSLLRELQLFVCVTEKDPLEFPSC